MPLCLISTPRGYVGGNRAPPEAGTPLTDSRYLALQVKAAALNPVDNVLCSGMLKDMWPEADKLPFKPGFDFAVS